MIGSPPERTGRSLEEWVPPRLAATGGAGDRITHRIAPGAVEEVDAEVQRWLAPAYERDG
ncbi:MAG TPA: hypothetical protein VHQ65_05360 [Thermoanaerobaculia bacterium]|nr:hypothetical protein [Thermoanaerobaculia bacterium]